MGGVIITGEREAEDRGSVCACVCMCVCMLYRCMYACGQRTTSRVLSTLFLCVGDSMCRSVYGEHSCTCVHVGA